MRRAQQTTQGGALPCFVTTVLVTKYEVRDLTLQLLVFIFWDRLPCGSGSGAPYSTSS